MKNGIKCLSRYGWCLCDVVSIWMFCFTALLWTPSISNRRSSNCFNYSFPIHFLLGSNAVYALCVALESLYYYYVSVSGIHWCWHSSHCCFCNHFFFDPFTICVRYIASAFSFFTFTFGLEIFSFFFPSLFSLWPHIFIIFRWIYAYGALLEFET